MATPWPWVNGLLQVCIALAAMAGAVTACYVLWEKVVKPVREAALDKVHDVSTRMRRKQSIQEYLERIYENSLQLTTNGGSSMADKVNRLVEGQSRVERLAGASAMTASEAKQIAVENQQRIEEEVYALRAALQSAIEAK